MTLINQNDILNALPVKYYLIDIQSKKIVQTNNPNVEAGDNLCYKTIFNKNEICQGKNGKCICQQLFEKVEDPEFVIEVGEGKTLQYFKAIPKKVDENLVLVNYINVSDEILAQKELKINSKRLERAEHLVDFGYWEFNIEEKIMHSSSGAQQIYGVEVLTMPLEEAQKIPLPKYRESLNKSLHDLIKYGKPYNIKFEIKRPNDGEIRFIHSIAEFRKDKNMVFGVIHDITETTQVREAIFENEAYLQLLFTNINSAFAQHEIITDENGVAVDYRFIDVNPKFEELVGKKRNEIRNKTVLEDFPGTKDYWIKRYGKVDLEGEPIVFTDFSKELNKYYEVSAFSPQKGYFAVSFNDVTDRVKHQQELNKTNNLLQTLIDNLPDAIYMKDVDCKKLMANKQDLFNCGLTEMSEILGKTDFDLFPKKVAELYFEDDRQVIEKGESILNREEILPGKNKDRWTLTSKIPLKDEEGKIYGLVGIGRDITEVKEKETQVRLLQKTIEQSPLAVVITNPKGDIDYVNHGFENVTGYNYKEGIGKNPEILKSGKQSPEYYQDLWETILSGKNWYGEFHNKRKDGSMYWESAVIAPITNELNKITHFVAVKEDITKMKQMIADLEKAKEEAVASDRLKTLFLANMSHEIRTPLNGILGFSSIICSGISDPEQLEYYGQIIENSGKRLMTVIDDIIDISMIQSNQLKIELEPFDINELLKEIFVVYHSQYNEKLAEVEFNVEYCENLEYALIFSDKNRIYQVLKNLLDNAFKFTSNGSIEFGCNKVTKRELTLYVKDTGIGIDESKQEIIFESFRQAEEGNSRKFDGSGLGLAIITGILEKLKGKINVTSKLDEGSVFYVTIPRNDEKFEWEDFSNNTETIRPVKSTVRAKRIVSFEDDATSIEYLKTVVGMLGYNLVNFVYAKDGIEYLRKNNVDMILMDVQLPEMSGLEATRIIKKEFPGIPVIIQTAFAMSGDMEKAFESGCDDYISKPLSVDMLKQKIKRYVEN